MRSVGLRHLWLVLQVLGVAAAYWVVAELGLLAEVQGGPPRVVRPQMGVAVAALLLFGLKALPGVALGSFFINLSVGAPPFKSAVIAAGTSIGPTCAYLLLRRVGFRLELDRVRDAVSLVVLAAFGTAALSAAAGLGLQMLAGMDSGANLGSRWFLVSMGSALGVLIVTPLVLVLRHARWPRGVRAPRVLEAVLLLASTFLAMLIAVRSPTDLLFLAFPFLIWAALRFQLAGTTPCVLIVSAVAVYGIPLRSGLFAGHDLMSDMITLEAFITTTTLTSLVLAVVITERNQAHQQIHDAAEQLLAVVHKLDHKLRPRPPTHFRR